MQVQPQTQTTFINSANPGYQSGSPGQYGSRDVTSDPNAMGQVNMGQQYCNTQGSGAFHQGATTAPPQNYLNQQPNPNTNTNPAPPAPNPAPPATNTAPPAPNPAPAATNTAPPAPNPAPAATNTAPPATNKKEDGGFLMKTFGMDLSNLLSNSGYKERGKELPEFYGTTGQPASQSQQSASGQPAGQQAGQPAGQQQHTSGQQQHAPSQQQHAPSQQQHDPGQQYHASAPQYQAPGAPGSEPPLQQQPAYAQSSSGQALPGRMGPTSLQECLPQSHFQSQPASQSSQPNPNVASGHRPGDGGPLPQGIQNLKEYLESNPAGRTGAPAGTDIPSGTLPGTSSVDQSRAVQQRIIEQVTEQMRDQVIPLYNEGTAFLEKAGVPLPVGQLPQQPTGFDPMVTQHITTQVTNAIKEIMEKMTKSL